MRGEERRKERVVALVSLLYFLLSPAL